MTKDEAIRIVEIDAVIEELNRIFMLFAEEKDSMMRIYCQKRIETLKQEKQTYGRRSS